MLKTLNNSVDSFRQNCQNNIINPIIELQNEIDRSLENIEAQNSIIDLYDEIKDLDETNPLNVERVLEQEEKDIFGSSVYRNIKVEDIPLNLKAYFEQYISYIAKDSELFSTKENSPLVLIEYSYEGDKNTIYQAYGINPMLRKYHDKKLKKTMYLTFDLIGNKLGISSKILNQVHDEISNWEGFSKYLSELKPGEQPKKPEWMSDAQWSEIYSITLKEVYEEQERFNRESVCQIPSKIAEMYFEKMKKEKSVSQKSEISNVTTIANNEEVVEEKNKDSSDNYAL